MSERRLLPVNDIDLCVETFGTPGDPAVLLSAGVSAAMEWWDHRLCRDLARDGHYVVRYDHRDTGESVHYPAGRPGYGFDDLVADAAGLLDVLRIERAHVIGSSLGGGIGQRLALDHPDRVASLTVLSASPGIRPGAMPRADLPQMDDDLMDYFMDPPEPPDGADRAEAIEFIVRQQRIYAGSGHFDRRWVRRQATRVVDRTADITATFTNHSAMDPGEPYDDRLAEIKADTLIIHGALDPLFPPAHAAALRAEIPGARLIVLPDVGHLTAAPDTWDVVLPAVHEHIGGPARPVP